MKNAINMLKEKDLDIVVCDYYKVFEDSDKKDIFRVEHFEDTNLLKQPALLFKISSSPWNKIFNRSLFDSKTRFPEHLKYEDLGLIPILLY